MFKLIVGVAVTDMSGDIINEIICTCIGISDCDASDGTIDRMYVDATVGLLDECLGSVLGLHVGVLVIGLVCVVVGSIVGVSDIVCFNIDAKIAFTNKLYAMVILMKTNVFIIKIAVFSGICFEMIFINIAIAFVDVDAK